VGANTAMFSVVHSILFLPLPFAHTERLATVWQTYPQWREREGLRQFWDAIQLAYPEYERLRDGTTIYEAVSIYRTDPMPLTGLGGARRTAAAGMLSGVTTRSGS
jgi:hypothetical protein